VRGNKSNNNNNYVSCIERTRSRRLKIQKKKIPYHLNNKLLTLDKKRRRIYNKLIKKPSISFRVPFVFHGLWLTKETWHFPKNKIENQLLYT